ncbi:C4-dicarboxylic acid transporter DauA [Gammaproteobacteria bacterium]|nr:C4-dicarboxylic acid transporter DauA [Gammaproteobacteria bacterium]
MNPAWHLFVPKLVTTLRQGYGAGDFRHDLIAGLTVAIVALPLAMALAIASGITPANGLVTAVVAGFLISALGGSRFQIGGPTGAFVVIVYGVIARHGYDGLLLATLMAGLMLVAAGLVRLGTWIKYIPEPVVTGFTSGIAVIIFSSQVKDLLGLELGAVPADFFAKWAAFWDARASWTPAAVALSAGALALILVLRRHAPRAPGFLLAIIAAALVAALGGLPVETIGSRFGGISGSLPAPSLPAISLVRIQELLPSAFTIAFLAGIESLLSAVVADGMTGRRHRSNCELVAQGVANTASALFGGLPATGAIARTATSIRSGARSPVAGMLHALFLLLFMWFLAPLAAWIPMASLAAVLVMVAWNMSEVERFRHLLRGPVGDRVVLLVTFGLTVAVDLTVAIAVGVVLASMLFMHRMSEVAAIASGASAASLGLVENDVDDFSRPRSDTYSQRDALPPGVEVFQFRGPLFFGVADRLSEVIDAIGGSPRVFILRMREVPLVDATGAARLRDFVSRAGRCGTRVLISGLQPQPREVLAQAGVIGDASQVTAVADFAAAVALARQIVES